jgi:glucose/arabinose dehydrogenase
MSRRFLWLSVIWQLAACSGRDSVKHERSTAPSREPDARTPADAALSPTPDAAAPTSTKDAAPSADAAPTPPAKDAAPQRPTDAAASGDARVQPPPDAAMSKPPDAAMPMPSDAAMPKPDAAPPEPPRPVTCVGTTKLDAYVSDPKLCVYVFAQNVSHARQIAFAPNGDLFVDTGSLLVLWDANKNGASDADERATFSTAPGLNHGVAFSRDNKFVYASSATTVYRWAYSAGQRTTQAPAEVVVSGIPDGGHSTRTLAFDSQGRLIVSIGSGGNVDTTQADWDTRSQIRRFVIPSTIPSGGLGYASGEILATGMRNEAGVFVDEADRIWGVENGRDNLSDADLGGDIHNDNPGEEINLVDGKGPKFYGYPLCFSEFKLSAGGRGQGAQWADQTLDPAIQKTDAYCRDTTLVRPPAWVMPAHWAPLGIIRYTGRALPMKGDLIVGAHGSWNRDPATGRVIARARLSGTTVTALDVIVGEKDSAGQLRQGTWDVRPVDVRQGPDDAIYVSDDMGGRVLKIGYAN